MSHAAVFGHQTYHSDRPAAPYRLIAQPSEAIVGSDDYFQRIAAAGEQFAAQGVAALLCVPGTFAGGDPTGLLTELGRYAPSLSKAAQNLSKRVFDGVAGERGNYTRTYVEDLRRGLNLRLIEQGRAPIQVQRLAWSSENNHVGRADGAVRLLNRLFELSEELVQRGDATAENLAGRSCVRIQLWGHSHGGNVIALAVNLLAANEAECEAFFEAARRYYHSWFSKSVQLPRWKEVQERLADLQQPLRQCGLDVVTYGTPIRYAWPELDGLQLVHFVNHRPRTEARGDQLPSHASEEAQYRTTTRLYPLRAIVAADGDYVHRVGIAGSNFPAVPIALRAYLADRSLGKLLESDANDGWLLPRLFRGMRIAESGQTVLADYGDGGWQPWRHVFGHAVYTRRQWLPFHCEQIARTFGE